MIDASATAVDRTSSTPRLGYLPALDGVRAIAIALVVSWHAFGWPTGGFLGVHVFFVLSGFLITTLLLEEHAHRGAISLRHFYLRRALRLLPALIVFLATYVAVQVGRAYLLDPPDFDLGSALRGVAYSAFYVSNVVQAWDGPLAVSVSHLWSLATEEQFYVLWPFALAVALRLGARPRQLAIGLAVAVAAIAAHRARLAFTDVSHLRLYYAPDTTFDALLVGCLLAIGYRSGRARTMLRSPRVVVLWLLGAVAFAAPTIVVARYDDRLLYWALLLPFAATAAALVAAAAVRDSLPARLLALSPLVFLGQISYPLYLWHPLVLQVARRDLGLPQIVGVGIAIAVAAASYALVERPFLRLKRRDRERIERPLGALLQPVLRQRPDEPGRLDRTG